MALRLRRDVTKASYYVWFLGAEEARGLRGPKVINSLIPYLIERSREQEPLKVTLQVSHKGIKILQGSSKHFIPHSAITSSIQTEDIVACVLLLYNPATKCPLHVHAYRCDSETTAQALNQQLQTLINRPENQKRLAELESRLGINQNSTNPDVSESKRYLRRMETSPKRFESSLGSSDTGTSTRESECSEENIMSSSPMSPGHLKVNNKGDLFDSLAAELRAKLNGNGPPILLPPRDYDTVHRSKGNLAAIELRRCRNSLIVGATNSNNGNCNKTKGDGSPNSTGIKQQVSSRGSSGIGSDLAPSPERQNENSSSDDENWSNEAESSVVAVKTSQIKMPLNEPDTEEDFDLRENITMAGTGYKTSGAIHREISQNVNRKMQREKEDEIRPRIMHHPSYDVKFKRILMERQYSDEKPDDLPEIIQSKVVSETDRQVVDKRFVKYAGSDNKIPQKGKYPDSSHNMESNMMKQNRGHKLISRNKSALCYREPNHFPDSPEYEDDSEGDEFHQRENLTDRQKYHQEYNQQHVKCRERNKSYDNGKYEIESDEAPIPLPGMRPISQRQQYCHLSSPERERQRYAPAEPHYPYPHGFDHADDGNFHDRNPYKRPENSSYRESIEKMMKSPVMRFKSFEEDPRRSMEHEARFEPERPYYYGSHSHSESEKVSGSPTKIISADSPSNVSPKDRFHDAKEKFRAMERNNRQSVEQNIIPARRNVVQNVPPMNEYHHRRGSFDGPFDDDKYGGNWSDEEQFMNNNNFRGEQCLPSNRATLLRKEYKLGNGMQQQQQPQQHSRHKEYYQQPLPRMTNAKSLSNLTKGYRHSYAEPRPAIVPRNSGRVGLAAVNPF